MALNRREYGQVLAAVGSRGAARRMKAQPASGVEPTRQQLL
jgi:hypothetical protein